MRIGIDARMYGPKSTTGIGAYIKSLTASLFLLDGQNEYFLFMREPAYSEYVPPNPRVKKVRAEIPWYSFSEQLKMPALLLKYHLDLVHFPHFNAAIFYPKKFVVSVHDVTPKFFPGPNVKKSRLRKIGYEAVFSAGVRRAKKIITISDYTKQNLIKYFRVPPAKIEITYLAADSRFREAQDFERLQKVQKKYNISKPFLFYVGVWRDHKNLEGLVSAFDILKSEFSLDYQLVLGGQPDGRYPEIKQAIDRSKYRADIILPGFIVEEELPLMYQAAALFVLPSFCEGFGLVALESLACGTPVVGSNTTSLPEILEDAAVYFNPSDPKDIARVINEVLSDRELYYDLKNRGLSQVKKFSWQDCARKTLAVYQSV